MAQFLWVIFPYLCIAVLVVGTIYRYSYDQIGWGSKSSEILEKRLLRWGSLLFHWGLVFVFFGHVMGLLIPIQFYQWLGVSSEFYHMNAEIFGGLTGLAAWVGILLLLIRRIVNKRVRLNSSPSDYVALCMLFIVVSLGLYVTTIYDSIHGPYEYRTSVGPWFRQVLTLHPQAALMLHAPLVLQMHAISAFLLFAISPFTRLVHIWSAPFAYITRAPILYRSRAQYRKAREETVNRYY
ncbi:respiratory nitrate reductase subunit gamma [Alicyclobacillus tolerans]|uniref:respiratory nitrate reductase subunit gamma n=1 Tax=Alicyclobacillus tolerans TaxID=90970 RepID=UPI001F01A245|nr:respiratory nitrate reductase subunit gamma [Alicyclobacillus tolerans]MCF8567511.1 respiratory nitrate reductase subunit gamma [Alicyclobacillus tolerans]